MDHGSFNVSVSHPDFLQLIKHRVMLSYRGHDKIPIVWVIRLKHFEQERIRGDPTKAHCLDYCADRIQRLPLILDALPQVRDKEKSPNPPLFVFDPSTSPRFSAHLVENVVLGRDYAQLHGGVLFAVQRVAGNDSVIRLRNNDVISMIAGPTLAFGQLDVYPSNRIHRHPLLLIDGLSAEQITSETVSGDFAGSILQIEVDIPHKMNLVFNA